MPPIAPDSLPGLQEHLLGEVLSLGMTAGPEVQIPIHPLDEPVVQLAERVRVAGSDNAVDKSHDAWFVGAFEGLGRLRTRY